MIHRMYLGKESISTEKRYRTLLPTITIRESFAQIL